MLLEIKRELEDRWQALCTANTGVKFRFWIGGAAEISFFALDLRLTLPHNTTVSCKIIWTAFGERGFDVRRTVTSEPSDNELYPFSDSLQGVEFELKTVSPHLAAILNVEAEMPNFWISWGHSRSAGSAMNMAPGWKLELLLYARIGSKMAPDKVSNKTPYRRITTCYYYEEERWMPSPKPRTRASDHAAGLKAHYCTYIRIPLY